MTVRKSTRRMRKSNRKSSRKSNRRVRKSNRKSVRKSNRRVTKRYVRVPRRKGSASQAGTSHVNLYDINTQIRLAIDALQNYDNVTTKNYGALILEYVLTMKQAGRKITLNDFYDFLNDIEYPNLDYLEDLASLIAPDYD